MKHKWVQNVDKETCKRVAEQLEDKDKDQLLKFKENPDLAAHEKKVVDDMKKRKLITIASLKSYKVEKGESYAPVREKFETDLTVKMLTTGAWKEAKFKQYNFASLGTPSQGGHLHPLLK